MIPLLVIFGASVAAAILGKGAPARKPNSAATSAAQASGSARAASPASPAVATHEMGIPIQPEASIALAVERFTRYQSPSYPTAPRAVPVAPAPAPASRVALTSSAPVVYGGSYLGTRGRLSLL